MSAENRTNHPGSKRPCGKVVTGCSDAELDQLANRAARIFFGEHVAPVAFIRRSTYSDALNYRVAGHAGYTVLVERSGMTYILRNDCHFAGNTIHPPTK